MVERAGLITVDDKTDVDKLGRALRYKDYWVVSYGGTAKVLREAGVPVVLPWDFLGDESLKPDDIDGGVENMSISQKDLIAGALVSCLSCNRDTVASDIPVLDMAYVNLKRASTGFAADSGGIKLIWAAKAGKRDILIRPAQIPQYVDDILADRTPDQAMLSFEADRILRANDALAQSATPAFKMR